ncbi:MAG: YwaF family protein [Clostridia bacterium]|nr:YwaF family protein [Clostridia bacterium]
MTLNGFWEYIDGSAEAGKGFTCFSLPHLLWLAVLAAGIFFFSFAYKRSNEKGRDNLRKGMALFLILFEFGKQCVVGLTGAPAAVHLPLHICSFAEFAILIDAFWPNNRLFKPVLCYAFLPAASMALLFPTVTAYPPISFYAIHQFVLHAAIIAYIIARYAGGDMRMNYAGVWISLGMILAIALPVYFIDKAFDRNYMFLLRHSNNPALKFIWNLSGGGGGFAYILGLALLVLLMFHFVFGLFTLIQKLRDRQKAAK